jgi:hypothetical protein
MFGRNFIKLCILFSCSLLIIGCAKTMKAMDEGAANIIHAITPGHSQQEQTVKVKSTYKSVNVRSDPSTLNPPITSLPGGMEVLKISENADWVQIRLDMEDGSQMDGWISKKMVE